MMPSALLSSKARALISLPVSFPTSVTLRTIEGARLLRIVSTGTGSAPSVSSKERPHTTPLVFKLPTDSATVEGAKNPHFQLLDANPRSLETDANSRLLEISLDIRHQSVPDDHWGLPLDLDSQQKHLVL